MKKYEQILGSLIGGGIVVILVADVLRQIIVYLALSFHGGVLAGRRARRKKCS